MFTQSASRYQYSLCYCQSYHMNLLRFQTKIVRSSPKLHTMNPSLQSVIGIGGSFPTREVRVTSCLKPKSKSKFALPARDRSIEFGKYKGKMLGTLPSSYLKWVSKKLRENHLLEEWAELADQVLQDPVYRERIEWEYAHNVLSGDRVKNNASSYNAVDELWEIQERFDWDFDDEDGWSKVDFQLLGTSYGGRIPRKSDRSGGGETQTEDLRKGKKKKEILPESEDGREQRRLRRLRRQRQRGTLSKEGDRVRINEILEGKIGNAADNNISAEGNDDDGEDKERTAQVNPNPFPGREALFRKALKLNNYENRNKRKFL